jgi:polyisoprenoid-binding protein YceI
MWTTIQLLFCFHVHLVNGPVNFNKLKFAVFNSKPLSIMSQYLRVKIIPLYAFLILIPISSFSQTFELSDELSCVQFFVRNFGLTVEGNMKGLSGYFVVNKDSVEKSHFHASVRCETVDTGIALRNKHLRQDGYFDVDNFPAITITSRKITRDNKRWLAVADLTIKKVTRQITVPFTIEYSQTKAVFVGKFNINRQDFGVGGSSLTLADIVEVDLMISGFISK